MSGLLLADGGSGNDQISGFLVSRVRCGSGRDLVDVTAVSGQKPTAKSVRSPKVEVGRDCERLTIGPEFDDQSSLGQMDPEGARPEGCARADQGLRAAASRSHARP